jgi:hypothetical protein
MNININIYIYTYIIGLYPWFKNGHHESWRFILLSPVWRTHLCTRGTLLAVSTQHFKRYLTSGHFVWPQKCGYV